jgi:chemotaxis protein methyltransferase CheR
VIDFLASSIRPVTAREFGLYRTLVESQVGIHLSEAKQALLTARLLPRIRQLGLKNFSEYYELAVERDHDELGRLLDAICTNETHFFREPSQFEILEKTFVPRWIAEAERGERPARINVWSAGCSTGEEPYSLAMALTRALPPEFTIEILATDVSSKVLARARDAIYPMRRLHEVPEDLRKRFLLRGVGEREGEFRIAPEMRRLIRFEHVNLVSPPRPTLGHFDLVLCRNVLIYFRAETRKRMVRWLCSQIVPGGYLWVGHSESLHDVGAPVRTVVPTVYRVNAAGRS